MKKPNILLIDPGPVYYPTLVSFTDKFKFLSKNFWGTIITAMGVKDYKPQKIEDFTVYGYFLNSYGMLTKLKFFFFTLKHALKLHRVNKFDCIICYDPMFTGLIGVIVKIFTKAKLVVEINSFNHEEAIKLHTGIQSNPIKRNIQLLLSRITLRFADRIKVLTSSHMTFLQSKYQQKVVCFHDFVPTHYFEDEGVQYGDQILCIGWPFYLKGGDVLIKAFQKIEERFLNFKLHFIGHQLKEDALKIFPEGFKDNIIFSKAMPYDELKPMILNAYCLVLPSRTEGMGKVLLEAMAAKKPVIGANVGGIPEIINDQENGFLFESENADDLASKLERLLLDKTLAIEMGKEGFALIQKYFSSDKYVEKFKNMIGALL